MKALCVSNLIRILNPKSPKEPEVELPFSLFTKTSIMLTIIWVVLFELHEKKESLIPCSFTQKPSTPFQFIL